MKRGIIAAALGVALVLTVLSVASAGPPGHTRYDRPRGLRRRAIRRENVLHG